MEAIKTKKLHLVRLFILISVLVGLVGSNLIYSAIAANAQGDDGKAEQVKAEAEKTDAAKESLDEATSDVEEGEETSDKNLDDQKKDVDKQAKEVEESLEFVDANIAKTAGELTKHKGQVPIAQQELNSANYGVAVAQKNLDGINKRLNKAKASQKQLKEGIKDDQATIEKEKQAGKKIVTDSYKNYTSEQQLDVIPSVPDASDAHSVAIEKNVQSKKSKTLAKLASAISAKKNSLNRLDAVEAEISNLKVDAEAALETHRDAQKTALQKKTSLDDTIAKSEKLNKELEAKRPQIEKKIKDLKDKQSKLADEIAEQQKKQQAKWEAEQKQKGVENPEVVPAQSGVLGLIHPMTGPITSGYGWRETPAGTIDFFGTGGYMHTGIDFGVNCGTDVLAAADGTVEIAGWQDNGGGNTIKIDHGIIGGNAVSTIVYHNQDVVVQPGQQVKQGDVVSHVGSTGNSTGCHGHFEVWINGEPIDPSTVL